MARTRIRRFTAPPVEVTAALDALRERHEVPTAFTPEALAEAGAAAAAWADDGPARFLAEGHGDGLPVRDARDLPLVTIDPPGSMDLDQAVLIERADDGAPAPAPGTPQPAPAVADDAAPAGPTAYRVTYAIASLATFVLPGGALDRELHARGETVYAPDHSTPLHPEALSHAVASLLPGQDVPACLWTIGLDAGGAVTAAHVERALVRSRARLTYAQVQAALDAPGDPAAALPAEVPADLPALLEEVGLLRAAQEAARGGVSLSTPEQEVVTDDAGRYALTFRATLPVEQHNAQVSLLTGVCAAQVMTRAGTGLLRTMPPADPEDVERLRRVARALGVAWPAGTGYPDLVRSLSSAVPREAAFLARATSLFRGAGYTVLGAVPDGGADGAPDATSGAAPDAGPASAPASLTHAAIGAPYAHVTAPLRRLVDRYGLEACLALCAARPVPTWVLDALPALPGTMAATARRSRGVERGAVDVVEALVLAGSVGEVFDGVVTSVRGEAGELTLTDPAVVANVTSPTGRLPLGQAVRARLTHVDTAAGQASFELV